MPRLQNSISIRAERQRVFDITNDIPRWPEYFDEYVEAKVLTSVAFLKLVYGSLS